MRINDFNRATGFDILKVLCAFLIICIHCPFPGIVGEYIICISRCAVPIFFMITGFFYNKIYNDGKKFKTNL